MRGKKAKPENLREACVGEALAIIESEGVEKLSLREVARRLGVSHQAPYKHFPSRDHILAEVVTRAFAALVHELEALPPSDDPQEDLTAMARAYLAFSQAHPLQYRLMFATPLPDSGEHPQIMEEARRAFSTLNRGLSRLHGLADTATPEVLLDSLFVWSTLHGLSGISSGSTLEALRFPPSAITQAAPHVLTRLAQALEPQGK